MTTITSEVSQDLFRTALTNAAAPVPRGLTDGHGSSAGCRYDVYRNNVAVSLTEALHKGFPLVAKILGKQNMDGLSGAYLRQHPPNSPLMFEYGADFADFIAKAPQLAKLPFLADVARLDYAMRVAYHAADHTPIDPSTLGDIPPEALMACTASLAPSVQVVASDWPLFDIWRFNTVTGSPQPAAQAQDLLITRTEYDPVIEPLPEGGADWIKRIKTGATLLDATTAAQSRMPEFDPGPVFAALLTRQAIEALSYRDLIE